MEGTMKVAVMTGKKKMEWCEREIDVYKRQTLVTGEFVDGLTDQTIYEYAAERFPLRGLTEKGY